MAEREPDLVMTGRRSLAALERDVIAIGEESARLRREIAGWNEQIKHATAGLDGQRAKLAGVERRRKAIIAMLEAHGVKPKPATDPPAWPEPEPVETPAVVEVAARELKRQMSRDKPSAPTLDTLAASRIQFAYGGRSSNSVCWPIIAAYNAHLGGEDRKLVTKIGRLLPLEAHAKFAKRPYCGAPITVETIEKIASIFEWGKGKRGRRRLIVARPEAFRAALEHGVSANTIAGCVMVSSETIRRCRIELEGEGIQPTVRTPEPPPPPPRPLCCVCGKPSDPDLDVDEEYWCSTECMDVSMKRLDRKPEAPEPEVVAKQKKPSIEIDWALVDRMLSDGATLRQIAPEAGIGRSTLQRYLAHRRDEGRDPRRRWNVGDAMSDVVVGLLDAAPGTNFTAIEVANLIADSHSPDPFRGGKRTNKAVANALSTLALGGHILSQESSRNQSKGRGPTYRSLKQIGRGAIRS